jgi:2-methylcitrate dehydratase PrpD
MKRHNFIANDISKIIALVPPLVHRLVGRPNVKNPEANYAKLCLAFVAGTFLARGNVDMVDFRVENLNDLEVNRFAQMVTVELDTNPDLNALDPQKISVNLKDGTTHVCDLPYVYGHPKNPLSEDQNVAKFRRCCTYGTNPLNLESQNNLILAISKLEDFEDFSKLMVLASGSSI